MSYEWPIDPQDLFHERYPQMTTGLLPADVDAVRASIKRMWVEEPGGWVYEWSHLAKRYVGERRHDLATIAYGWAKFPTLANDASRRALQHQLEQYGLWSREFPVDHERRVLHLPMGDTTTPVAVNIFSPKGAAPDTPVLLASGGVDSWKMDLPQIFLAFAQHASLRVIAFDIPGTGESMIPMSPAGSQIVTGLVAEAKALGAHKVGHLGISMGGYFSARSGLAGEVDAAIVLGGPVEAAFDPKREASFGMSDIVGNALGFSQRPQREDVTLMFSAFTLRPLLQLQTNAPMLIINGADDIHIPQHDTLVFEGRKDTQVELLANTGHCAVTRFEEVMPKMIAWMAQRLR
ncbi:alpha/beta fold hydrolase [Cupriavidus basilensis]|uniref:alpha/beta fold hydrolase n=1 Tax=Cupriavidus basilensis TaxID=68895 RepID=UPI0039F6F916